MIIISEDGTTMVNSNIINCVKPANYKKGQSVVIWSDDERYVSMIECFNYEEAKILSKELVDIITNGSVETYRITHLNDCDMFFGKRITDDDIKDDYFSYKTNIRLRSHLQEKAYLARLKIEYYKNKTKIIEELNKDIEKLNYVSANIIFGVDKVCKKESITEEMLKIMKKHNLHRLRKNAFDNRLENEILSRKNKIEQVNSVDEYEYENALKDISEYDDLLISIEQFEKKYKVENGYSQYTNTVVFKGA